MPVRDPFGRPRRKRGRIRLFRSGWWARTTEEIYVYRTRKPRAPWGLPIIGRHFGYGGRTSNPAAREHEHLIGGKGRFGVRPAQPWADLKPKKYVVFGLKSRTELTTHLLECLVIRGLFCVYNDKLNHGNPRRVSLSRARAQRAVRERWGHRRAALLHLSARFCLVHVPLLSVFAAYVWSVR